MSISGLNSYAYMDSTLQHRLAAVVQMRALNEQKETVRLQSLQGVGQVGPASQPGNLPSRNAVYEMQRIDAEIGNVMDIVV